jgi:hypothetical protein
MDPTLLVLDVKEKELAEAKPPAPPTVKSATTGFPGHKKRGRVSAFKQQRQSRGRQGVAGDKKAESGVSDTASDDAGACSRAGWEAEERRKIDRENQKRLEDMSSAEIEDAQKQLLSQLDPSVIQMLLRRPNLDETNGPTPFDPPPTAKQPVMTPECAPAPETEAENGRGSTGPNITRNGDARKAAAFDEDAAPAAPPADLFPITFGPSSATAKDATASGANPPPAASTADRSHFPHPPSVPDLVPSEPDFLPSLHSKYFPSLPADPTKLAWMAPLPTPNSPADRDSPYHPSRSSLPVSQLRFDFRGALLPPRLSRLIPVTQGLHHHGEAPEAAGYTVPELARLARSAVPAQRCLAFQTLGRILFRLGKGEWGHGEGGRAGGDDDDLAFALWRCLLEGRVLDSLEEAASVPDGAGHRSSKVYATEALWLLEKGGWKERWKGR